MVGFVFGGAFVFLRPRLHWSTSVLMVCPRPNYRSSRPRLLWGVHDTQRGNSLHAASSLPLVVVATTRAERLPKFLRVAVTDLRAAQLRSTAWRAMSMGENTLAPARHSVLCPHRVAGGRGCLLSEGTVGVVFVPHTIRVGACALRDCGHQKNAQWLVPKASAGNAYMVVAARAFLLLPSLIL